MVRQHRYNWTAILSVAFIACTTLACTVAEAQVKPIKIRGEGVGEEGIPAPGQAPRPHWIVGNATHLGLHDGQGTVQTDSFDLHVDPVAGLPTHITGEFGSGDPFEFVAANGDKLVCHYGRTAHGASEPGWYELTVLGFDDDGNLIVQALWVAEFVPQPDLCTGRFAGVTGGWTMVAWSEPFVLGSSDPVGYAWEGDGKLVFPQKGKGRP